MTYASNAPVWLLCSPLIVIPIICENLSLKSCIKMDTKLQRFYSFLPTLLVFINWIWHNKHLNIRTLSLHRQMNKYSCISLHGSQRAPPPGVPRAATSPDLRDLHSSPPDLRSLPPRPRSWPPDLHSLLHGLRNSRSLRGLLRQTRLLRVRSGIRKKII